jgi:hypothetical protein
MNNLSNKRHLLIPLEAGNSLVVILTCISVACPQIPFAQPFPCDLLPHSAESKNTLTSSDKAAGGTNAKVVT